MKNSIKNHQALRSALFSIMLGILITLAIEVTVTGTSSQISLDSQTSQIQQR